jgi:hypothetical protein
MKLTALKELQRPGPADKPVTVAANTDFDVADASEAKGLIRSGIAKPAADTAAAKPSAPAAPPASPAATPAKP